MEVRGEQSRQGAMCLARIVSALKKKKRICFAVVQIIVERLISYLWW